MKLTVEQERAVKQIVQFIGTRNDSHAGFDRVIALKAAAGTGKTISTAALYQFSLTILVISFVGLLHIQF